MYGSVCHGRQGNLMARHGGVMLDETVCDAPGGGHALEGGRLDEAIPERHPTDPAGLECGVIHSDAADGSF